MSEHGWMCQPTKNTRPIFYQPVIDFRTKRKEIIQITNLLDPLVILICVYLDNNSFEIIQ